MEGYVREPRRLSGKALGSAPSGTGTILACGVCTLVANQEHRVARLPCGEGNHITHARCVLVAVRCGGTRRGKQAPLVCSERGCGDHYGKRGVLDAAVQADPGLRDAAAVLKGRPEENDKGHRQGLYKIVWYTLRQSIPGRN